MKNLLFKVLLLLGYGPSIFFLISGVMLLPFAGIAFFVEPSIGFLGAIAILTCGFIGLRGLILLLNLSKQPVNLKTVKYQLVVYLILGIGASFTLSMSFVEKNLIMSLIFFLPIPTTMYLLYLNRDYFHK